MMSRRPSIGVTLLVVAGSACGGGSTAPATPSPPAAAFDYDPCAAGPTEDALRCADWRSWPRINAETFRSRGHRQDWVDVHVDPRFVEAYRRGAAPMPVGMRVIKAAHRDDAGRPGEVSGLTVMVKMAPGYDPDDGDWFYGVYDETGTLASQQGALPMCIGCHARWPEHDFLGGVPGLWER